MAKELRFEDRVVVITGAGNGLGRSHALLFGSRGAKVVVNDLGGGATGGGKSSAAADKVVTEIKAAGGEAVANYDSVEDGEKIVQTALDTFGRIDVVINNAGILRDVSFAKMTDEDWDLIYRVHVRGSYKVTRAAWPHLRDQEYGRIVMTASAAGIYGNFGQANYSMAKLGLAGFANTLALEGQRKNVHVNTIAPIAGSRLTETILPKELTEALKAEYVSPLVAYLCHEDCTSTGGTFEVGGGFFAKLRWERAQGRTFRVGRAITLESIRESWQAITGFEMTTHPTDVTSSMQPILGNIQAGVSKGGNELIDVDLALGYEYPEVKNSFDERDLAIYALGVGAATDPLEDRQLQLVYEMHKDGFRALPTFAVIPALNALLELGKKGITAPGLSYGLDRVLHGEQYTELKRPLPRKAKLTHRTKIVDIFDKGKNALVISETKSYDEAGEELMVNRMTIVVRGAGGWGGDRGPSSESKGPERKPDKIVEERIPANQALLYRLSGDWNPLHADPAMATAFGFPRPILHGLCTFGYATRHVITAYSNADPRYFKSIQVRFAESVFPGETLVTQMWRESETRVAFVCKVKEREKVVISKATIELYSEIPQPKPKAKPAGASKGASSEPISADVFQAIGKYIAANPDLAAKVATVYQFRLTGPDSLWTVDLKAGAVAAGVQPQPQCTLEMSDADFMDMCSGKADAQQLYFGGKLKISGDVMASQKLTFLKKLDPQTVLLIAKERAGGDAAVAAARSGETPKTPAAAMAPSKRADPMAPAIFAKLKERLDGGKFPLGRNVASVRFRISEPDAVWTLTVQGGKAQLTQGADGEVKAQVVLTDVDFARLARDPKLAYDLFMRGKLRVEGDILAARELRYLEGLI
jgi:3-hydroxyacyl-CoA dehydrogenase/3a,7a,12a-trihydroxy-5b-cholest-24-enoyl-CoA hydratase